MGVLERGDPGRGQLFEALGTARDFFSEQEEPVILVFFGDHRPGHAAGERRNGLPELGMAPENVADWTLENYAELYVPRTTSSGPNDPSLLPAEPGSRMNSSSTLLGLKTLQLAGMELDEYWSMCAVVDTISGRLDLELLRSPGRRAVHSPFSGAPDDEGWIIRAMRVFMNSTFYGADGPDFWGHLRRYRTGIQGDAMKHGFIKVAAAAPELRVADPKFNGEDSGVRRKRRGRGREASRPRACDNRRYLRRLYYQRYLLDAALEGLKRIAEATRGRRHARRRGPAPAREGAVYSAAAVVSGGEVLGFTARQNVRGTVFFEPSRPAEIIEMDLAFADYCCLEGRGALLRRRDGMSLPSASSSRRTGVCRCRPAALCAAGATVVCELSDEPMSVQSAFETRRRARKQTKRLHYGTVYAAPGSGESTTDKSYSGLCLVVDDGGP